MVDATKRKKYMAFERIEKQVEFILEMDKLKNVIRRNYINGGQRLENTAEHSWQVALQAVLLSEYASEPVDVLRVVKMLLIHDIVEIIAGDTYIYDLELKDEQAESELAAAETLFGMLPPDQKEALKELWLEFEAKQTPDARFAKAMDRLLPLLQNYQAGGRSWREHDVSRSMVENNARNIRPGSEKLWEYAQAKIARAAVEGLLKE
jgi:putative hydrolases of HD superfamily